MRKDFCIAPYIIMHTVLKTETKAKTIELQKKNFNVWVYTEILPVTQAKTSVRHQTNLRYHRGIEQNPSILPCCVLRKVADFSHL